MHSCKPWLCIPCLYRSQGRGAHCGVQACLAPPVLSLREDRVPKTSSAFGPPSQELQAQGSPAS